MTKIAEHIRELADNGDEIYAKIGVVKSVNTKDRTCDVDPIDGSATIFGVRLQADINGSDGFLIVPVKGSHVIVNFLNKNAAFVALTYDIDYVHLRGDNFGGLIKINELKKQLAKNTARIDWILNLLKSQILGVTMQPQSSWPGTITPQIEALQKEDYKDIENTKVKHG